MVNALRTFGQRLHGDTRGLTTVEYTIVLCLIAALCVGAWNTFGGEIKGYISGAGTQIGTPLQAAVPHAGDE